MALSRMVVVGDKVQDSKGNTWTINQVNPNGIAFFDECLEEHKEFNCFIAQFGMGKKVEFNINMTLVEDLD